MKKAYILSKELKKILRQAKKDIQEGKNLSPSFETTEELMAYLNSPRRKEND